MRTAEDYIKKNIRLFDAPETVKFNIETVINDARKDLLLELAGKTYITEDNFNPAITKSEILQLINEIE